MKNWKKLLQNNSGSTIVIVVIAMAFIGILATMVLSMSVTNIQMKSVDRDAKTNFYEAETALDELIAGLETDLAKMIQDTYTSVMLIYADLPVGDRNIEFKKALHNQLVKKFDASGTYTSEIQENKDLAYAGMYDPAQLKTNYLYKTKDNTNITSTLATANLTWKLDLLDASEQYVILKGVKVGYFENDYLTNITTDIKIPIPNVNLESIGNKQPFTEYAIIAATQVLLDNKTGVVEGNLYAGNGGVGVNGNEGKLNENAN